MNETNNKEKEPEELEVQKDLEGAEKEKIITDNKNDNQNGATAEKLEDIEDIEETEDNEKIIEESGEDIRRAPEENSEVQLQDEGEGEEIHEEDQSEEVSEEQQLRDFHKNQIEAALYASGRALSVEEIALKLDIDKKEVEELINELAFDYLERSTALIIAQTGEKYQMQIKHEFTDSISEFAEGGAIKEKYLRTLTVIALKQPILKSLLVKLRGTGAYQHVKYLEKQGLIDSVKKGRTSELTTTDKYAEMFGLPKDKAQMKRVLVAQLGVEEET